MWIRDNDLVFVAPWNFNLIELILYGDILAAHADKLEQDGYLTNLGQMDSKVISSL